MKTIDLIETASGDGFLHLQVPVERAGQSYHVVVHVEPLSVAEPKPKRGWPAGFFEQTAGQWEGDFPEAPEGDFEQRAAF